ncbi:MAG: hypothetical protein ABFD81_14275 [Syntrophaceae bacterium]
MHRARSVRVVSFLSVCLLLLSTLLAGCGALLTGKLQEAETSVSSGKPYKGNLGGYNTLASPDILARKKLALAMNTVVKGDIAFPEVKQTLKSIQKDPYTSAEIKVEAGYLFTLIEKLEARQRDLDHTRQRLEKTLKDKDDMAGEKDAIIASLTKERDDLAFKIKKLEEISTLTEKRRGNR